MCWKNDSMKIEVPPTNLIVRFYHRLWCLWYSLNVEPFVIRESGSLTHSGMSIDQKYISTNDEGQLNEYIKHIYGASKLTMLIYLDSASVNTGINDIKNQIRVFDRGIESLLDRHKHYKDISISIICSLIISLSLIGLPYLRTFLLPLL